MTEDAIREAVARAIYESFMIDSDSFTYMRERGQDEMTDVLIDGDVNIVLAAQAAITALDQAGYVLAPREPTEAQRVAGEKLTGYAVEVYRAMIAAK